MSVLHWRFLENGRVAHALSDGMYGKAAVAACGVWTPSWNWRGTGSQREYDAVAKLPRCKRCQRKLR